PFQNLPRLQDGGNFGRNVADPVGPLGGAGPITDGAVIRQADDGDIGIGRIGPVEPRPELFFFGRLYFFHVIIITDSPSNVRGAGETAGGRTRSNRFAGDRSMILKNAEA